MSVAVVTSVYGLHHQFLPRWTEAVLALDPPPDRVVVSSAADIECEWRHPQAFYLDAAIRGCDTDWVCVADIDDTLMPDALAGLDDIDADVWQLGYVRSDGETYVPPHTTAGQYLASGRNTLVGSSMFRVDAYDAVGGYRDVALQDWDLWRRLFKHGARFAFSTRPHFHYILHDAARSAVELTADRRLEQIAEIEAGLAHA